MKIFLLVLICILGGTVVWQQVQQKNVSTDVVQTVEETTSQTVETKVNDIISGSIEKATDIKNTVEKQTGAVLDLSGQGLTKAPTYIFSEVRATTLDLSYNQIDGALQAEVRNLSGLRVLDLSHNNFTGVPAEVGQLSNLEVLNLSYNKLTGLPYELGNLTKLKQLDLRGNAYATQDLEKIKQTLPSTTVILVD